MYNLKIQIMIKCAFLFLRGIWQWKRNENEKFNVKSQDLEMHYNLWFINMQVSASLKNFETCHDNVSPFHGYYKIQILDANRGEKNVSNKLFPSL